MQIGIIILAVVAILAALYGETRGDRRGNDFAGWGVVFLGVAIILIERGGS
jgi:hypothetical protein